MGSHEWVTHELTLTLPARPAPSGSRKAAEQVPPRPFAFMTRARSRSREIAQHERQDTAVAVVAHFLFRIDPAEHLDVLRLGAGDGDDHLLARLQRLQAEDADDLG